MLGGVYGNYIIIVFGRIHFGIRLQAIFYNINVFVSRFMQPVNDNNRNYIDIEYNPAQCDTVMYVTRQAPRYEASDM